MQCACGVENTSNAKFCKGCGIKFNIAPTIIQNASDTSKSCPVCDGTLKPEAKFCGKCGYKFVAKPVAQPVPHVQLIVPIHDGETNTPPEITDIKDIVEETESNAPSIVPVASSASSASAINKKTIIMTALALSVISGASLAWVSLRGLETTITPITKVDNAKPVLAPSEAIISVATPAQNVPLSVSKYIGRTVKDQSKLDQYHIVLIGQSGGFKVLSAYEDDEVGMFSYTKIVLVTDQAGKVFDSKDVPETGMMLVDGKRACVINQKPYAGIYAVSSMESKLTTPTAAWVLNDNGKLINQDVKDVKCGMYVEFMPESDVIKAITGYNDLHKSKHAEAMPVTSNKEVKLQQQKTTSSTKKPATPKIERIASAPIESHQEQAHTQQQEPVTQDAPQKKQNNSLGGLFDKLGESIKKGATERSCSAAERAMGQCN